MSLRVVGGVLLSTVFVCVNSGGQDAATGVGSGESVSGEDVEFFEQQIAPILQRRCYECHSHESGKARGGLVLDSRSGWEQGGGSGPAIIPGKPDDSLLIQSVRYDVYEMPPNEKLPAHEIALLERWVLQGAADPRKSQATAIPAEKLWALQPITVPEIPAVKRADWVLDPLDAFLLANLEQHGLEPAADADCHTLLRRVTFDLTGLPPTLAEIRAFAADESADAFEKVVDRLLASPGFGDHWGRHWFDLSCYADLADIQGNVLIRDAWRYRDYVIDAFNEDRPLDQMILEQLAGDLLPYESTEQQRRQIIATGFLAIGPWTLQNYIKPQLEADVVDHQIDRIGRIFLGQTLSCARCHDHKFDPIPTADYYALAGIFHSTLTTSYDGPGVWSVIHATGLPQQPRTEAERQEEQQLLEGLQREQQTLQTQLTELLLQLPEGTDANRLTWPQIAANAAGQVYELSLLAGPSVWAGAGQATVAADGLRIDLLRADGSVLRTFLHQPGAWSGTAEAQQLQAIRFAYTGDGSGAVRVRVTSARPGNGRFGGAIDEIRIRSGAEVLFAEDFDQLQPGAIRGMQAATGLPLLAQAVVPGWDGAGINHTHAVEYQPGNYAVQFFAGSARRLQDVVAETESSQQVLADARMLDEQLQQVVGRLQRLQQQNEPELALAVRDRDQPADSAIYRRGSYQSPGAVVPRGFPAAVLPAQGHAVPAAVSGREQLARWLIDEENPLTSRVLVNRIWQHVFGAGLVRSVDYFGVHGESPSHPELLDFLAHRLRVTDGWSLQRTVRRMVLSRAYRMASVHDTEAAAADPENRLFWRMPRRRLTAEAIRDAMLSVSGELDQGRGGSPLSLELAGNIQGAGGNVNPATWAGKIAEDIRHRRAVYLPFRRERPTGDLEILSVFDFPHPNDITGARAETTVATQALFLMNSPFVRQRSEAFAERLQREVGDDRQKRIEQLYLIALGRPADAAEVQLAMKFLEQSAGGSESSDRDMSAAWQQLCHALLTCNGFLFRE